MKKNYTIAALFIAMSIVATAQFSDNFESYSVGDYLGSSSANWTTWSGSTGGAEDVQINDTEANDGTKSIYFSGSGGGGPQDVVLDFGTTYSTGEFEYSNYFMVEANKGAYINFQANPIIGEIWTLDIHMVDDGNMVLSNGSGTFLTTEYPTNAWFKFGLDIDLSTNNWIVLIDDVVVGSFANTVYKISSIDIFPVNSNNGGNGNSGFYMDQVFYDHTPYTLPTLNGAPINITGLSGVVGSNKAPTVSVRNLGTDVITSFDIQVEYNGIQYTENISSVSINSLDVYEVVFTDEYTLAAGANTVTATISNVNGTTDDNSADDAKTLDLSIVVPATGKMVIAEEGTGTWCQWCPRGAVMLDKMSHDYSDLFVGVAVHNGDPMTNSLYDDAIGFSSFPSSVTDRGDKVDPSNIESIFMKRITVEPKAVLTNGAEIDGSQIKVSVSADFLSGITGDYRLACIITEDSITGTGSGYAQSNAYAGGSNGEMGGYELLPSTVPASQMVYDHVARIISPSFAGFENSFPTTVAAGELHAVNFFLDIDTSWNMDKITIVSILIAPDGTVDNAGKATLTEAESNGFIDSATVSVTEAIIFNSLNVYPNPTSDITYVYLENEYPRNVSLTIYDISGKIVKSKNYGKISNNVKLPINTNDFEKGVYIISLSVGIETINRKLIVK